MGFRLANVAGRAVLIMGNDYYDVERVSNGRLSSDPMAVIGETAVLHDMYANLYMRTPDGTLDSVTLDAPIPRPPKLFAVGLNYRAHAAEAGLDVPSTPMIFTKFQNCITGPTGDIELRSDTVDWEVELVLVIGKGGRDIAAEDAWDHVAGLTVGQDVSDRRVQFAVKPPQFSMGKSFDTYGPIGPAVVSPDLLPNRDDLAIQCSVSGESKQDSRTSDFIFTVAEQIAYISAICTLEPGDIIFTGTPEGIGGPKGIYLQDGDVVVSTIEGVGTMRNRCVKI
ncbi:MAG: fumarylacetoacetate hydrolase family protein [Chloroflexota bacterium]